MEPPLRQRDKGKAPQPIPSNHRHLNGAAVAPPPPQPQQQPVAVEPPPPPPPVCPTPPLLPPPPCATSHHGGGHHPHNHHHRHQNHQHYNPYYPSSSTSSKASLKGCCCCLLLLLSFLFLLALGIALVVILAVKPKKPQFDLQQVGVQYMGINTPTPPSTTASISLAIRMLFTAVNPNKVGIKYGESRFTVMYRGVPLGKASVPGFFQEAHSQRQVEATVAVDRYSLMQADAADLVKDASLNDRVDLRVLGEVGAKIRVMNLDSPGVEVSVDCSIVISPRKQSLTYKQCGFDGLSV